MSLLYVNENGCTVGIEENRCVVKYPDGMKKTYKIIGKGQVKSFGKVIENEQEDIIVI